MAQTTPKPRGARRKPSGPSRKRKPRSPKPPTGWIRVRRRGGRTHHLFSRIDWERYSWSGSGCITPCGYFIRPGTDHKGDGDGLIAVRTDGRGLYQWGDCEKCWTHFGPKFSATAPPRRPSRKEK